MASRTHTSLTAREREIMDIVYRHGQQTASEIRANLRRSPSGQAVRTMLTRLEAKGVLRHKKQGNRFLYRPTVSQSWARRSALASLLATFFDGSPVKTVGAILDQHATKLSEEEIRKLSSMIAKLGKETRKS